MTCRYKDLDELDLHEFQVYSVLVRHDRRAAEEYKEASFRRRQIYIAMGLK